MNCTNLECVYEMGHKLSSVSKAANSEQLNLRNMKNNNVSVHTVYNLMVEMAQLHDDHHAKTHYMALALFIILILLIVAFTVTMTRKYMKRRIDNKVRATIANTRTSV